MSKLDSFIRRMSAQRDCLNQVAGEMNGDDGVILELGLGNGRTYDHLRELFGAERVYVFDRRIGAAPAYTPDDTHMILGDLEESLKAQKEKLGGKARLAHCDIGTGHKAHSVALAQIISDDLDELLMDGGIILSDQPIERENWIRQELPEGVPVDRYFRYQKTLPLG